MASQAQPAANGSVPQFPVVQDSAPGNPVTNGAAPSAPMIQEHAGWSTSGDESSDGGGTCTQYYITVYNHRVAFVNSFASTQSHT